MEHPASMTHNDRCVPPEMKNASGITDGLLRLRFYDQFFVFVFCCFLFVCLFVCLFVFGIDDITKHSLSSHSVGIEHVKDLIRDLEQALDKI